ALPISAGMRSPMAQRPRFLPAATLRLVALLVLVALFATGCGRNSKKDADEGRPVTELYEKGHDYMKRGNWAGAELVFRRLVAQYPYGPYTEQALMETAYAQYKAGKHDDAVSTIDRVIRTYPTHRNIAYCHSLRGLSHSHRDPAFLQRVWSLDASRRDLSSPQQAYEDFNTVAQRYPNSPYAEDARQRMRTLRDVFARHEMDSALYYMRRGAWLSAVGRAKYILETYPQSDYQNDAVAALAESYRNLGQPTLSDAAVRVLRLDDPQHPSLAGDWRDYPWAIRKLNPFAGERSPTTGRRDAERN